MELTDLKSNHALHVKDLTVDHLDWHTRTNRTHGDEINRLNEKWQDEFNRRVADEKTLKEQIEAWRTKHSKESRDHTNSNNTHHVKITDLLSKLKVLELIAKDAESFPPQLASHVETINKLRLDVQKHRTDLNAANGLASDLESKYYSSRNELLQCLENNKGNNSCSGPCANSTVQTT